MASRIPSASRKRPTPKSTPAPSRTGPAPIGDNSMHGEEAERVQLISIVSQLSAAEDAIEVAQAPLKAAQKKRSQVIGLGKAAGFTAKELTARLAEMRMGTREMAGVEERESKHRRWLGIIEPDQSKLILGTAAPQEVKDEAHWKGEGYKAGLRQMLPKPPPECPERFVQAWMGEHAKGLKEVLEANAPKAPANVREQAAADFKADNPEPGTPEAQAAERKAIRAAKEGLEKLGTEDHTEGETAAGVIHEPGTNGEAPFEATEEELAGQTTRQVVQAQREGDDPTNEPCPDCGAPAGEPCEPDCPSDAVPEEVV